MTFVRTWTSPAILLAALAIAGPAEAGGKQPNVTLVNRVSNYGQGASSLWIQVEGRRLATNKAVAKLTSEAEALGLRLQSPTFTVRGGLFRKEVRVFIGKKGSDERWSPTAQEAGRNEQALDQLVERAQSIFESPESKASFAQDRKSVAGWRERGDLPHPLSE